MYIIKNALRNISRSKGRNVLIGIIILVIVISATVSLSIRQAADQAKEDGLAKLNVTGNITIDREQMMKDSGSGSGSVDKDSFKENMQSMNSLSLTELQKYAKASSVKGFYYTLSSSVNASGLDPVESNTPSGGPGGSDSSSSSDFTLVGYSSDDAMTAFSDGTSKITSGSMFDEGTSSNECVISKDMAKLNSLEVGDTIKLTNPDNKKKTSKLKIVGIYSTSSSESTQGGGDMRSMSDPANQILTSYTAAKSISSTMSVDGTTQGTYTFASVSAYNKFEDQAHDLGLDDSYTVESTDINQFEQTLQPLENLSKYAFWFLLIVLIIGVVILVVINIFSVRERKYEIGVLSAMGMKKRNVAAQFVTETLAITLVAVIIGTTVGAVTSVPITNALLSSSSLTTSSDSFDRGGGPGGGGSAPSDNSSSDSSASSGNSSSDGSSSSSDQNMQKPDDSKGGPVSNYISSVSSATNMIVVLQIIIIGLILSVVASAVAITTILRFDPLNILTNRD